MVFDEKQLVDAIEDGLRQDINSQDLKIRTVECEESDLAGYSGNALMRASATATNSDGDQIIRLVIKRWAPGSKTGLYMGIEDVPAESLAWSEGMFRGDLLPTEIVAPYIGVLKDQDEGQRWLIMRDVSEDLERFQSSCANAELRGRYETALNALALMQALWEQPERKALLQRHRWLLSDEARLKRNDVVWRSIFGLPLDKVGAARAARIRDNPVVNHQQAIDVFMETLPSTDKDMWKRHMCDRESLIAAVTRFPKTLVHGDFGTRNIGLQPHDEGDRIVLIDWVWIGHGRAALDVLNLLTVSIFWRDPSFDCSGLTEYYFDRYRQHGGLEMDTNAWEASYELAHVYYAVCFHAAHVGLGVARDAKWRHFVEARTPLLTELMIKHLGR